MSQGQRYGLASYLALQALSQNGYRPLTPSESDWLHDHKKELQKAREEGRLDGIAEAKADMRKLSEREAA